MRAKRLMMLKKSIGILLALFVFGANYTGPVQSFFSLPDQINLQQGRAQSISLGVPLPLEVEDQSVVSLRAQTLSDVAPGTVELTPLAIGTSALNISLFGVVPVKRISLVVHPEKVLVPGGQSIGVSLYTKGTLVVGRSDVTDAQGNTRNPAREADLRPGDVILQVNDEEVKNSDHLATLINQNTDAPLHLSVLRGADALSLSLTPVRDREDGALRLGIWVRDSTAGVGTLTYYDPATGSFAALGHAITDMDTGTLLSVREGEVLYSRIIDVRMGDKGLPGELRGIFLGENYTVGDITSNTELGVFGKARAQIKNKLYPEPIPVGVQASVRVGAASILCTVDDEGVKEYDCQIVRITRQSEPTAKGMVVEITDPKLLEKTGGIVQGMSGSPILQDGCIIGAVTHVFVNDPTRGHGVFVDWMIYENEHNAA